MTDKCMGSALAMVATMSFAYFTVWILVTPFLDEEDGDVGKLRNIFPARHYAITAVTAGFAIFLIILLSYE